MTALRKIVSYGLGIVLLYSFFSCASTVKSTDLASEYYNLGNAYYKLGNYTRAILFFQKAMTLDESLYKAGFNLSLALINDGRPGEAEEAVGKLLAMDPDNQSLLEVLAFAYHGQDKDEDAVAVYQQILDVSPEQVNARYNLAVLLWKLENADDALDEFVLVLEYSPDDLDTLFNLGQLLLEQEQAEEAVETLEQYLQLEPSDEEAYMYLGKGYRRLERYDKALAAYTNAITYDEKKAEAWFYSAQILLSKIEDPKRGLTALSQALDYGFKDKDAILALLELPELLDKIKVEALLQKKGLLEQ